MLVREAFAKDLPGIALVYQAAFAEKVKLETFASKLNNPEFIFGVARERPNVIGFVLIAKSQDPAKFNVHYIATHPIDAPKGCAQLLMRWGERQAVAAGATHIRLAVRRKNARARKFYELQGFAVLEERDAGFTLIKGPYS